MRAPQHFNLTHAGLPISSSFFKAIAAFSLSLIAFGRVSAKTFLALRASSLQIYMNVYMFSYVKEGNISMVVICYATDIMGYAIEQQRCLMQHSTRNKKVSSIEKRQILSILQSYT